MEVANCVPMVLGVGSQCGTTPAVGPIWRRAKQVICAVDLNVGFSVDCDEWYDC